MLTHIGFVLEGILAGGSHAVEVRGSLATEGTRRQPAVL